MIHFLRLFGVLLLAFPLFAKADPVVLQASAQGTMTADSIWVGKFTGNLSHPGGPVSFVFNLTTEFDPEAPDFRTDVVGPVERAYQFNPSAVATLTIDGATYTINGGTVMVSVEPGGVRCPVLPCLRYGEQSDARLTLHR